MEVMNHVIYFYKWATPSLSKSHYDGRRCKKQWWKSAMKGFELELPELETSTLLHGPPFVDCSRSFRKP